MLILSVLSVIAAVQTVAPFCCLESSSSRDVLGPEDKSSTAEPVKLKESSKVKINIEKGENDHEASITWTAIRGVEWFVKVLHDGDEVKFDPWKTSIALYLTSMKKGQYQVILIGRGETSTVVASATTMFPWPLPSPKKEANPDPEAIPELTVGSGFPTFRTYSLEKNVVVSHREMSKGTLFRWEQRSPAEYEYSIDVLAITKDAKDTGARYKEGTKREQIAYKELGFQNTGNFEITVLRFGKVQSDKEVLSKQVIGYGRLVMTQSDNPNKDAPPFYES